MVGCGGSCREARRRAKPVNTAFALVEAVLQQSNSSRSIHVVQVGANFGDMNRSAVGMHHDVRDVVPLALSRLLGDRRVRAVMVEPNPAVFQVLNLSLLGRSDAFRFTARQLAICTTTSQAVDFHVVSIPRLLKKFPTAPRWAKNELSSLDRESVLNGLYWLTSSSTDRHQRNPAQYIDVIRVPCLHPVDFLREVGLAASLLDVLVVDAEGLDGAIISSFLADAHARPRLIFFEEHGRLQGRRDFKRALRTLRRTGYQLVCCECNVTTLHPC